MGRPLRVQIPGAIYHVTTRGIRASAIYSTRIDAESFLELLAKVTGTHAWICHAYCLMPSHYHLLVETPEPNLSAGIQALNARHARVFNLRHGHSGHLFDRRFHAGLVEPDRHLLEVIRYIALNPVRARLCLRPGDWRWSSYLAVTRGHDPLGVVEPERVLKLFGRRRQTARRAFARFVADALPCEGAGSQRPFETWPRAWHAGRA